MSEALLDAVGITADQDSERVYEQALSRCVEIIGQLAQSCAETTPLGRSRRRSLPLRLALLARAGGAPEFSHASDAELAKVFHISKPRVSQIARAMALEYFNGRPLR